MHNQSHPVAVVDALKAKEQEGRILLDVEVQEEVIGTVEGAASTVRIDGPYGKFEIDAFEASVVDGKALSQANQNPPENIFMVRCQNLVRRWKASLYRRRMARCLYRCCCKRCQWRWYLLG